MARNFHRKDRLSALSEINMTPLIDLAFALLIIFMITTPLLEQSIDINLPKETQKPQVTSKENHTHIIGISKEGTIYWGDKKVDEKSLLGHIHELRQQNANPIVDIRADEQVRYQKVISVIDMLKQENIVRISLNTQAK